MPEPRWKRTVVHDKCNNFIYRKSNRCEIGPKWTTCHFNDRANDFIYFTNMLRSNHIWWMVWTRRRVITQYIKRALRAYCGNNLSIFWVNHYRIQSVSFQKFSVGIDLKELGVSCRNVWNFAQGLKFMADFHSKMSVCRHELGSSTPPPSTPLPRQFQPCKNCRKPEGGWEVESDMPVHTGSEV